MQLSERYTLYALTLKQGKRELYVGGLNYLRATYEYNGKEINSKEIDIERYFKFYYKYRGMKTIGYNRPSINTLEFYKGETV